MQEQPLELDGFYQQVCARFGFVPNFFRTAPGAPGLMEELWSFAKSAYLDIALPPLFKERLFVHLSRFCEMRYCIVRHVGFLIGTAGARPAAHTQSIAQVVALLSRPVPDGWHLDVSIRLLEDLAAPVPLPEPETPLEGAMFDTLAILFVTPKAAERARAALAHAVGPQYFELLTAFLAFVRTAHFWTETHPSMAFEQDVVAMMREAPRLAELLLSNPEAEWAHSSEALRRALNELDTTANALRTTETRFEALVMASSDVLYRMSPDWSELVVMEGKGFLANTFRPDPLWLQRYIPAVEQPRLKAAIEQAIGNRDMFELEHLVLRLDGTVGFVLSRACPSSGTTAGSPNGLVRLWTSPRA